MHNDLNSLSDQRSSTRRLSGSRRLNLDSQRWRNDSDSFSGLPAVVATPHQLLAVAKGAAPAIQLNGTDQRLLDKLFQYTRPIDWAPPSRPIVSVSNEVLGEDLSLSRSAIQRALRRLQQHGLIVMKDSPTGQRYFRRHDKAGAIVADKSFGIDLAILAVRYVELKALAERHAAEKKAKRDARRRAIIAWRMVAQSIATADEEGLWSSFWDSLEQRARTEHNALPMARSFAARDQLARSLESMASEARDVLTRAFKAKEEEKKTTPADRASATLNNYTEGSSDSDLVSAQQKSGSRPWPAPPHEKDEDGHGETESEAQVRITPQEIVRLVPEIRALAGPVPTWADLGEACERIRADLEIGHRLWNRAHASLGGPQRRIVAFADMLTYPDEHFIKGRGAYFAGMVKLAEAGSLNLGSSLYGMRKRGSHDRPAAKAPRAEGKAAADVPSVADLAKDWVKRRKLDS